MIHRYSAFSIIMVTILLIPSFSTLFFYNIDQTTASVTALDEKDFFSPIIQKPAGIDKNSNQIADNLDQEIAEKTANGLTETKINVNVILKSEPTTQDIACFISSGGQITTPLWTEATYGFGGKISCDGIEGFLLKCNNLLLVEKEAIGKSCIAYASQQIGARTYVWSTLGLQGDSNTSIALLDSGIDASHVDFLPGYGDQDFSKKIVGWNDQVTLSSSPFDDNGHGSHVAGLAAGNGFTSVDSLNSATATWRVSTNSSTYTAMMVNKTGLITLSIKWSTNGTSQVSSLRLFNSGKSITSWSQVSSTNTPNTDMWYTLTYNVASEPLSGYDMYNPAVIITSGTGVVSFVVNMSWPYTPPADTFSTWTGIAPQSKIVGVKVANSDGVVKASDLISGINWIITNRARYHITVASLSLGFDSEVSSVNQALVNLVNSGVTTVVAAGNGGKGGNYIFSPGSVDETITVAAMNQFDNLASYSSQGGTSRYSGQTTKPDITAPGGSINAVPLYSADVGASDAAPMLGTSMATPIIAGCAQAIIQAMGGYSKWNWTKNQALQPKMMLLMTATETYPNIREEDNFSSYSPTLERGGKDRYEGFGRVNLDVALDAILRSYSIGTEISDILGRPPTTTDISVVGQKLAWARNVELTKGYKYNFSLVVPTGSDFDMFIYNNVATSYGEPIIAAKSINATTGGVEQFYITPPTTGTYYIVIKRATETTINGNFTLTSSKAIALSSLTIKTPGLDNASNVVHYTQNGTSKIGSIYSGNFVDLADVGTTLTIDNPIFVSSKQRYYTIQSCNFEVPINTLTYTVNFKTQYYLSIDSLYGSKNGEGWYDNGTNAIAFLSDNTVDQLNGTRRIFDSWNGDFSGSNYAYAGPILMNASRTLVVNWKTQFLISFLSTPSNGGSTDPATNIWIFPEGVSISAAPNSGFLFSVWSSNTSEITFLNATSKATTALINGPGMINADFVEQQTPTPVTTSSSSSSSFSSGSSHSSSTKPKPITNPTTNIQATTENGSTVNLSLKGNVTSAQMSDLKIITNQTATTTIVSFNVTGQSGTIGFGNLTIPKSSIPYGKTPLIYIDNDLAESQGYAQDENNYYVWYTTHFSIHKVSIVFSSNAIPEFSTTAIAALTLLLTLSLGIGFVIKKKTRAQC
jgi:subtilisin family serine protease